MAEAERQESAVATSKRLFGGSLKHIFATSAWQLGHATATSTSTSSATDTSAGTGIPSFDAASR